MFKKLFIGLAPLLAIAAFAVMPVAGQAATPHWYKDGVKMPEGEEEPIVIFGNEVNLSFNSGIGEFNCQTVGGGTVDNPVGGGAGEGKTNLLGMYECKAPQCEAAIQEKFGVAGHLTVTFANNPGSPREPRFPGYTNQLEESTVGGVNSVREKIGEPFTTFQTPSPPGMVREIVSCVVDSTGTVVTEWIFEGEYKPEIGAAKGGNLNGTSAGNPSALRFNGASTGALHSAAVGEHTYSGLLKYLGYYHQDVFAVKP